ncbi:acetyltransferase [Arenicellales bacterium IMCC55707]
MSKSKKLIIIGDSAFAEIAYQYFEFDSSYKVVGFAVEREYLERKVYDGLSIVPFENLENYFSPKEHYVYVAVTYTNLNRTRTRLMEELKYRGYQVASYVSSNAFVWRNVELGEHCFIFENNVLQPFTRVESNVVLWSGNHIGHHSVINSNCFISSQVVISGFCNVGVNSFIGVNATIGNNVNIGRDNWLGPNTTVLKDTPDGILVKTDQSTFARVSSLEFFRIDE